MNTIRVNAQLLSIGTHEDSGEDPTAVFRTSIEGLRKLAPALHEDAELSVVFTPVSDAPMGSLLGLMEAKCPCCKADVYVATVQVPAVMRVYVDKQRQDRVVEYDDGNLAILPTFKLHAESCTDWPEDKRDWRGNCEPA